MGPTTMIATTTDQATTKEKQLLTLQQQLLLSQRKSNQSTIIMGGFISLTTNLDCCTNLFRVFPQIQQNLKKHKISYQRFPCHGSILVQQLHLGNKTSNHSHPIQDEIQ